MNFENLSGSLALDLAGTLSWRRDRPREMLRSPEDVVAWAASEHIRMRRPPTGAETERLRRLRETIYGEFARRLQDAIPELAPAAGAPQGAGDLLASASLAPASPELDASSRLRWSADPAALESTVSRSALETLDAADELTIRECARTRCTRLFIDRSRGRRTWCGMATCGNREKAARWRARHPHG